MDCSIAFIYTLIYKIIPVFSYLGTQTDLKVNAYSTYVKKKKINFSACWYSLSALTKCVPVKRFQKEQVEKRSDLSIY